MMMLVSSCSSCSRRIEVKPRKNQVVETEDDYVRETEKIEDFKMSDDLIQKNIVEPEPDYDQEIRIRIKRYNYRINLI